MLRNSQYILTSKVCDLQSLGIDRTPLVLFDVTSGSRTGPAPVRTPVSLQYILRVGPIRGVAPHNSTIFRNLNLE